MPAPKNIGGVERFSGIVVRVAIYVALYQAIHIASGGKPAFPPLRSFTHDLSSARFFHDIGVRIAPTLLRWLLAWSLGSVLGIGIGLIVGIWPRVHQHISVDLDFFRSIPGTLLAFFVLALGLNEFTFTFPCAYICFFVVVFYVSKAANDLDRTRIHHLNSLGAKRFFVLRNCLIPEILPGILLATRQALSLGLLVQVSSEMIIGAYKNRGLGNALVDWKDFFEYSKILTAIIILGIIGMTTNLLMEKLERWLTPWAVQKPI